MHRYKIKNGDTVTVRKLARGDTKALQEFDRGLSEQSRYFFPPHSYDGETIEKLIERNERGKDIIYIAEYEKEIVAYFFLWHAKHRFAILGMCVADNLQGMGLGRYAMELLIKSGKEAGLDGILLSTTPDNERAFNFYKKHGFQYIKDVESKIKDGSVRIERCMFLSLREGAKPGNMQHKPPV